jgi:hypothetical protein
MNLFKIIKQKKMVVENNKVGEMYEFNRRGNTSWY